MKRNTLSSYLFILPIIIFVTVFISLSVADNIVTSFFEWNGLDPIKKFIGFDNYINLYKDPTILTIFKNFSFFFAICTPLQMIFGMVLAYIIKTVKVRPVANIYKTLIFIPVIISPVVIGYLFSGTVFEYNYGLLNQFLRFIGAPSLAQNWLGDPSIAILSCGIVFLWQWTGFAMLLYYAGMMAIPSEVFEAASIDGANKVKTLFSIVAPMLRSTHYSLAILGAIGCLKMFDLIFVLTNGGPADATQTFSTYMIAKSITQFQQGYGSTIAVILFVMAMIITVIQLRLYNKKVG